MKTCERCGRAITYGVNGCQMMNICFKCNGGYPDYSRNKSNFHWNAQDYDALDFVEGKCIKEEGI